jgi:hypothetical protein
MASNAAKSWRLPTVAALTLTAVMMAIVLISFSSEEASINISSVDLPPEIQRCSTDADCILLKQIGCCSCKSGGARGAINAAQRDAWRRFIKGTCRYRGVCVRVKTCQYDLAPACVVGRCVVRAVHG